MDQLFQCAVYLNEKIFYFIIFNLVPIPGYLSLEEEEEEEEEVMFGLLLRTVNTLLQFVGE